MATKEILVGVFDSHGIPVHKKFVTGDEIVHPEDQSPLATLDSGKKLKPEQIPTLLQELSNSLYDGNSIFNRDANDEVSSIITTFPDLSQRTITLNKNGDGDISSLVVVKGDFNKTYTFNRNVNGDVTSITLT